MAGKPFTNRKALVKNLLFLALASLFLSGCAQLIRVEQPAIGNTGGLAAGQTIGQTFVAKYNGLAGIYFYLYPQEAGNGEIKLHLRSTPQATQDLAVSANTLAVNAVKTPGYYGFFVPAQAASNRKYYYAFLETTGSGEVQVGKAAGDTYLNGASYQNGTPEDAQLAFQLSYSRREAFVGLGIEALTWAGILAIGFFLFILPGLGLFRLLWPDWGGLAWPEKLGLSAGLSLAIYPLMLLWTDIIGLHLGAIYAWLPPLAGLGIILWRNRSRFKVNSFPHFNLQSSRAVNVQAPWADVAYIGILALIILTRFWAIRSLDLPMWGDSYQHTMIAQLLVDHGGLFNSWQPYTELTTFTYHFGFHSAVAVFDWITHLSMPDAVLWVGQLLNVLAVMVLYPLATKIGRSRWAGVLAVLVAGLLSPMPMVYVNWGRDTQLAGQVILPVAVWLIWNILMPKPSVAPQQRQGGKWDSIRMWVLGCFSLGGLALTHYRILILAIVFLAAFWILYARRDSFRLLLRRTFWLGIGGGLLFLPWFIRVFGGRILQIFAAQMTTSATQAVESDPQLGNMGNISTYLPVLLWITLFVVIGIGIWRREKATLLISLWWFGNLLVANPYWLGLPGAGAVTSFTVLIAMYIPAAILVGAAASWLIDLKNAMPQLSQMRPRIQTILSLGAAVLLIGVGGLEVRQRVKDVQPSVYALATRPDVLAAKWIQKNTDPTARLLVNSFPAFQNNVVVGSDGGWWLPLLSERKITVPPIIYGFEKDPWPGYSKQVNALTFAIQAKGIQNPDILLQLKERGISYIYIGQLQGQVNSGGPLFTVAQLLSDPNFHVVYHQDRVWIFQIQWAP